MGLRFESFSLQDNSKEQVNEWHRTGDHSFKGGIQFLDLTFDNEDEAIDWLSDNTDKWYGAKAVQAKIAEGMTWVVGGWVDY